MIEKALGWEGGGACFESGGGVIFLPRDMDLVVKQLSLLFERKWGSFAMTNVVSSGPGGWIKTGQG